MNPATFVIESGPVGLVGCRINGEDVLPMIAGVQVNITDGQPTEVFLRRDPGASGTIQGDGIVYVQGGGIGPAVREFLASIDTVELESEILSEAGWGNETSTVQAVINKLIGRSHET